MTRWAVLWACPHYLRNLSIYLNLTQLKVVHTLTKLAEESNCTNCFVINERNKKDDYLSTSHDNEHVAATLQWHFSIGQIFSMNKKVVQKTFVASFAGLNHKLTGLQLTLHILSFNLLGF